MIGRVGNRRDSLAGEGLAEAALLYGDNGGCGGGDGFRGVYDLGRAFSGQTSLADFVEQGAITDFELAGGTLAIPAIGFENAQDDFAFEIMDGLAGNFFEMDGAVGG